VGDAGSESYEAVTEVTAMEERLVADQELDTGLGAVEAAGAGT
jgi:hypothetical protein